MSTEKYRSEQQSDPTLDDVEGHGRAMHFDDGAMDAGDPGRRVSADDVEGHGRAMHFDGQVVNEDDVEGHGKFRP